MILVTTALSGLCAPAVADSYLEMIEAETEKIGAPPPTATEGEGEGKPEGAQPEGAVNEDFVAFREFLKRESLGSYTFFEKLGPAQQQEVFARHEEGAALEEIREMIMERFLQR